MIWVAIQKFNEIRKALEEGNYRKVIRLVIEIIDILVPEDETAIREVPARTTSDEDMEKVFREDVKAVHKAAKSPPRGAKAKGAGGMIIVALVTQLLPVIIDLIRKRLKEKEEG